MWICVTLSDADERLIPKDRMKWDVTKWADYGLIEEATGALRKSNVIPTLGLREVWSGWWRRVAIWD